MDRDSVMRKQQRGVRAAKGVAREDGSVEGVSGKRGERDRVDEARRRAANGAGNFLFRALQRGEGDGELDEPATAEGVAEAALPGHERRAGKRACHGLRLEPAGL